MILICKVEMFVANSFLVPLFLKYGNDELPEMIVTVKSSGLHSPANKSFEMLHFRLKYTFIL